jgi:hypothetical protein
MIYQDLPPRQRMPKFLASGIRIKAASEKAMSQEEGTQIYFYFIALVFQVLKAHNLKF